MARIIAGDVDSAFRQAKPAHAMRQPGQPQTNLGHFQSFANTHQHTVINNAGIAVTAPLAGGDMTDAQRVIDTNLMGALYVLQASVPALKAAGGGVVVNIASVLGHRPLPHTGIYAASKAAIIQITRSAALELARDNIRVNALAPGYVVTDLNRAFLNSEDGQRLQKRTALRRFATPDELMPALMLLLDPANSYMTGETITMDGGMSAGL